MHTTTATKASLCKTAHQLLQIVSALGGYRKGKGAKVMKCIDRLAGSKLWPFDLDASIQEVLAVPKTYLFNHAKTQGLVFKSISSESERLYLIEGFVDILHQGDNTLNEAETNWLTQFCLLFNIDPQPLLG